MTNGTKAKRMEFRIRHTIAYLRYVGQVQVVCSEPRKRPEGRRKYFACNDLKVTARQIMLAYRLRWAVEIFHKNVKQHLGLRMWRPVDLPLSCRMSIGFTALIFCYICHRLGSPVMSKVLGANNASSNKSLKTKKNAVSSRS